MTEPLISLLHPTVRPKSWKAAADNWFQNCDRPEFVEYVLVPELKQHREFPAPLPVPFEHKSFGYNEYAASTVGGSNYAAKISHGKILILVADDFFSAPHWDTNILNLLNGKLDQEVVIWPDTGIPSFDDHFISLPILTRAYYERIGYLFWPEYTSFYADADFTGMAKANKVEVINARGVLKFKHVRGGLDQSFPFHSDPAYKKNGGEVGEAGGKLFGRRQAAGFPR
jgi:hypothetical protein